MRALRALAAPLLVALGVAGLATAEGEPAGRQRVAQALVPARESDFVGVWAGLLATGISSLRGLLGIDQTVDPKAELRWRERYGYRRIEASLPDGTRVGGLLFEPEGSERPRPLLLVSFGFLQDRWGGEAVKFHELYIGNAARRIPGDVVVLDHPTSGAFLGANGQLSVGSYDDARIWVELALRLRRRLEPSSIHLLGVSMSGQTVVHALIEDGRRSLGLFASGLAVSIAPDFVVAPGAQLAAMKTASGTANPWLEGLGRAPTRTERLQTDGIWLLALAQFLPSFRLVAPDAEPPGLERDDLPVVFRRYYAERIAFLRESAPADWPADFSLESLEAYMETTRIARVIDRVPTPLVLLSARDDPAVPRELFREVVDAAEGNAWVVAHETNQGGHFGFDVAYGAGFLDGVLRLMLDPQVLRTWNGPRRP
jgi:predicted alpha/beta-fold hydrolase